MMRRVKTKRTVSSHAKKVARSLLVFGVVFATLEEECSLKNPLFSTNVLDREADQTGKWISKNAPKK